MPKKQGYVSQKCLANKHYPKPDGCREGGNCTCNCHASFGSSNALDDLLKDEPEQE